MSRPTAIEARNVAKSFRVQGRSRRSARESLAHPLQRSRARHLDVLQDISFDVGQGEFFGVVGRNGSGKSTLLKLLASIYRANSGRIRIAGRLAPFLELGVGFNPQLAAYDNVVTNGVMMGLSRTEARRRFDEVIAFAGLEDYTDLKLKNYSSGMKVRLGFSVMAHVDADVHLIDEVLAVGDAAFQAKCGDVFRRLHEQGKTIVLVTHSMGTIERYCDRAMLIHDGVIERIGDPHEVASRYLELNVVDLMQRDADEGTAALSASGEMPARIVDLRVESGTGGKVSALAESEALEVHGTVAVDHPIERPALLVEIQPGGRRLKLFASPLRPLDEPPRPIPPGERLHFRAVVENRLAAGLYQVQCSIAEDDPSERRLLSAPKSRRFEVAGEAGAGFMGLDHELELWSEASVEVAKP